MPKADHQSPLSRIKPFFRKQNGFSLSMLILILFLTGHLIFAPKPWNPELDFSTAAKSTVRTHSYVIAGAWWAALVNLFLVSIALFLSRFYPQPKREATGESGSDIDRDNAARKSLSTLQGRFTLILSLLAVALSAWLNVPRLNHSLWGDEEATTRRFIVGQVSRQDDGSLRLRKPSWEKTLWNFDNGPNNHNLFSILGRLSHGFARPGNGPGDYYFSEFWIRLPAFLSGLGAVAAIAWLMVVIGFPRAAPLAAFALALHPWFVRWGTEARGYALELFFIPLVLVFLLKALDAKQSNTSWRWWAAYGFTEFLLIYSHLGAVYFLVPLNIAAFVLAWKHSAKDYRSSANPFRQSGVWRLAAANLLGAFLTIQLMAPCLKPLGIWLGKTRVEGDITWSWMKNWFGYFASGMSWSPWDKANPYCLTLAQFLKEHPYPGLILLLLLAIGSIAGLITFLSKPRRRWLLLPLLAPGLLTVLHAKLGGNLLYPWYMVGFLPLSIAMLAAGLDSIGRLIPVRPAFAVISIFFLIIFGMATQNQRQLYRDHPVEALAESVRKTREVINPFHPHIDDVITLDIVHATRLYDPAHLRVRSVNALVDALKQADSSNRPLYLNLGNPGLLSRNLPGIGQMIHNRSLFEDPILIHGLQNPCTRYIFRYIPDSIDTIPLPANPNKKS